MSGESSVKHKGGIKNNYQETTRGSNVDSFHYLDDAWLPVCRCRCVLRGQACAAAMRWRADLREHANMHMSLHSLTLCDSLGFWFQSESTRSMCGANLTRDMHYNKNHWELSHCRVSLFLVFTVSHYNIYWSWVPSWYWKGLVFIHVNKPTAGYLQ